MKSICLPITSIKTATVGLKGQVPGKNMGRSEITITDCTLTVDIHAHYAHLLQDEIQKRMLKGKPIKIKIKVF